MVRKLESYLSEKAKSEADDRCLVSRTEERREKQRLESERFELATQLTQLKRSHLDRLELPDALLDLIDEVHVIQSPPARTRALKRLRAELRDLDLDALAKRMGALGTPNAPPPTTPQQSWRNRLLEGGDPALAEFVQQYPHADRAQLRLMVRQVMRKPGPDGDRASKKLLGLLQQILGARESKLPVASPRAPEE